LLGKQEKKMKCYGARFYNKKLKFLVNIIKNKRYFCYEFRKDPCNIYNRKFDFIFGGLCARIARYARAVSKKKHEIFFLPCQKKMQFFFRLFSKASN